MVRRAGIPDDKKKEYIESPYHCPFCNSDELDTQGFELLDGGYANQDVACNECKKRWTDIYKIVDVESEDSPGGNDEKTREWEERWHKR